MEIKPEIKYTDQGGKKDYFVGVKGSLTWEEFGKFFKKYILRKKELEISKPKDFKNEPE